MTIFISYVISRMFKVSYTIYYFRIISFPQPKLPRTRKMCSVLTYRSMPAVHLIMTFDLLTSGSMYADRLPWSITWTNFGVDSSSQFPFSVKTDRQTHTDRLMQPICPIILHIPWLPLQQLK